MQNSNSKMGEAVPVQAGTASFSIVFSLFTISVMLYYLQESRSLPLDKSEYV